MKAILIPIIFVIIWISAMLFLGKSETPDIRDYERNSVLENPCNGGGNGHPLDNCW